MAASTVRHICSMLASLLLASQRRSCRTLALNALTLTGARFALLAVDHEENGCKQDAWLREWMGASEGDYFESKGAKKKKLTPEERKEEAAKSGRQGGRQAQAAARRGEWTPNHFGGDPSGAGQLTLRAYSTPHPPLATPCPHKPPRAPPSRPPGPVLALRSGS